MVFRRLTSMIFLFVANFTKSAYCSNNRDFSKNLVLMFMSNHLIYWPTLKNCAQNNCANRNKMLELLCKACLLYDF